MEKSIGKTRDEMDDKHPIKTTEKKSSGATSLHIKAGGFLQSIINGSVSTTQMKAVMKQSSRDQKNGPSAFEHEKESKKDDN